MNVKFKPLKFITCAIVISFFSCDKNDFPSLDYSRLETKTPEAIEQGGVRFSAIVLSVNNDTITDHGFIWVKSEVPPSNINTSEKISLGEYNGEATFKAEMEAGFELEETYTVRAFLQSKNFTFLGNPLSFVSLGSKTPTIQEISPVTGTWGDTVILKGDNYGLSSSLPEVFFETLSAKVVSKTQTEIRCIVPDNLNQNIVEISINTFGTSSKALTKFLIKAPTITNINKTQVSFDDTVKLEGDFIVNQKQKVLLMVGNTIAQILDYKVNELKFKVPSTLNSVESNVSVIVNGQQTTAQEKLYLKAPVVSNLDPELLSNYNSIIKLNGDYFSPVITNNIVTVGGMSAEIISSTKRQIQFRLPQNLQTRGSFAVTVQVLGQSSVPVLLTINSPFRRLANFPTTLNAGYYAPTFHLNDEFYFGLGQSNNELYVYNPDSNTWIKKTNYPGTNSGVGYSFVLDGYAYIGKGLNSDFWRYSPEANNWILLATIPDQFNYGMRQGAVVNGSGYIIEASNYFRTLSYNIANDSWSEQLISDTFIYPSLLNGAFTYNNSIYTIASSPNYSDLFFSIFIYDISNNSYSIIDQFEDEFSQDFFFNNKGIQVGSTMYFFQNNTLYGFDMANRTWSRKNIYSPVPEMGNILFSKGQKLFLGRPNTVNNTYEFWELDLSIVP